MGSDEAVSGALEHSACLVHPVVLVKCERRSCSSAGSVCFLVLQGGGGCALLPGSAS